MPRRIQMTRHRPWRADHPDAVIVDRRTAWGNPFDYRAAARVGYGDERGAAADAFRGWLLGHDWGLPEGETRETMAARRQAILDNLHALRGHDLACWCPLDAPCHADVLLDLANRPVVVCGWDFGK